MSAWASSFRLWRPPAACGGMYPLVRGCPFRSLRNVSASGWTLCRPEATSCPGSQLRGSRPCRLYWAPDLAGGHLVYPGRGHRVLGRILLRSLAGLCLLLHRVEPRVPDRLWALPVARNAFCPTHRSSGAVSEIRLSARAPGDHRRLRLAPLGRSPVGALRSHALDKLVGPERDTAGAPHLLDRSRAVAMVHFDPPDRILEDDDLEAGLSGVEGGSLA